MCVFVSEIPVMLPGLAHTLCFSTTKERKPMKADFTGQESLNEIDGCLRGGL